MSSNAYTVNIVNAEELYVAGDKISGFRLGAVKERDSNIGLNTDFPKLQLDISGTGAIRIPAGTTADRSSIKNSLISGSSTAGIATDLLGVLRYNKTTSRYEAIYEHTLPINNNEPKWGNFVMEDSSGNVGIGTNNPSYRLDVNGNGRFNGQFKIGNFSVTQPNTDKQVLQITAGVRQISIGGNGNNTYIKAHEPGNYDNNSLLDIIGHTINLLANTGNGIAIENNETTIGFSNNKLIVDSAYAALSTPGMEFLSDAFFLLKKTSSTSHWNLIMDRLGDYWSGFRSSHHWDTYYDSDKYNVNATGTTMYLQYYSLGNISLCHRGGFVGIGGNPSYPLHIRAQGSLSSTHDHYGIYQSPGSYMDAGAYNRIGIGATNGYYTNTYIAMKVDYGIWTSTLTTSSDRRIKTNIRDVPDDLSLKQLRELPCVYYDYIDYQKKGDSSTIGFIAQDVKKVMPMAVSLKKEFIPNEMRNLIEPVWETITDEKGNEKFKLTINDLDISGNTSEAVVKPTKFRFYVNNGDNEKNLEIENLENEPKSFIFEEKWKNIFLYGKEVDDFHIIEKDKIFAMLFSATQEIDKIQQEHAIEIAKNKEELQKEKTKIEEQTTEIISLKNKIITLETQYNNLQQQVQTLIDNQ